MNKLLIFSLGLLIFGDAYAQSPFRDMSGLTKNGIEWCQENYQLYQIMGNDFFEHHQHSIESRLCGNLYNDPLWFYTEDDRYEVLIEKSREYYRQEILESQEESEVGIIDTKPVSTKEIPQEIASQMIESKNITDSDVQSENNSNKEITIVNQSIDERSVKPNLTNYNNSKSNGGGCLIATATYGSEMSPQVQFLREIRDGKVMTTSTGAAFMESFNQFYYSFSPYIADYERENPAFKETVKIGITPLLASLSIMNNADTETEILGYGIGVILLNVGMYFGIPFLLIFIKKKRVNPF